MLSETRFARSSGSGRRSAMTTHSTRICLDDWLIGEIEQKLGEGIDAHRLAAYMTGAVRSRYGLDDPPPVEDAAARLVASGG